MGEKIEEQRDEQTGCIFVDADSFPVLARDLAMRMARKRQWHCCFAANRPLPIKAQPGVFLVRVPPGKDMADHYLCTHARAHDIVLTRDILLAELLVFGGVTVINHLGQVFDKSNIAERRSVRDFSFQAHQSGLIAAGQKKSAYGQKELGLLANSLDRMMTILIKNKAQGQGETT